MWKATSLVASASRLCRTRQLHFASAVNVGNQTFTDKNAGNIRDKTPFQQDKDRGSDEKSRSEDRYNVRSTASNTGSSVRDDDRYKDTELKEPRGMTEAGKPPNDAQNLNANQGQFPNREFKMDPAVEAIPGATRVDSAGNASMGMDDKNPMAATQWAEELRDGVEDASNTVLKQARNDNRDIKSSPEGSMENHAFDSTRDAARDVKEKMGNSWDRTRGDTTSDMSHKAGEKLGDAWDYSRNETANASSDANRDTLHEAKEEIKDAWHSTREKTRDAAQAIKEKLQAAGEKIRDTFSSSSKEDKRPRF